MHRNTYRCAIAGSVLAFALASSPALALPVCPPPPEQANPNGSPPLYIDRDVETCRRFSEQITYDQKTGAYGFFWLEMTDARLQVFLDSGFDIRYTDRLMAGEKMQLLEYFNTTLNHYFLAIADEWGAIDRGEAGPGWTTTGHGFTVRKPISSPLSQYVFRFYGSVSPGPNSHFFTMDAAESHALQDLANRTPAGVPRWNSEGISFNAFPLSECGADKTPVWRAYNGGAARGLESNHRYSADKAVIDGMVSQGWIAEGVAFCADVLP